MAILSSVPLLSDFYSLLSKLLANGYILDQQKKELEMGPGICYVDKSTEDESNWLPLFPTVLPQTESW